jgi:hypothetical protein
MSVLIQCPSCRTSLSHGFFNLADMIPCPSCQTPFQIEVFPALFRPIAVGRDAEPVMVEGESSCFYHTQKKAVLPCDSCGRFLCALCDCEVGGQHFCPSCLEAGRTKRKIKNLEKSRTLYDSIALSLTIYPMLCFYPSFICAPIAVYVAVRYWNTPLSIVRRTKLRYILALTLATLEILACAAFIYLLIKHKPRYHG